MTSWRGCSRLRMKAEGGTQSRHRVSMRPGASTSLPPARMGMREREYNEFAVDISARGRSWTGGQFLSLQVQLRSRSATFSLGSSAGSREAPSRVARSEPPVLTGRLVGRIAPDEAQLQVSGPSSDCRGCRNERRTGRRSSIRPESQPPISRSCTRDHR